MPWGHAIEVPLPHHDEQLPPIRYFSIPSSTIVGQQLSLGVYQHSTHDIGGIGARLRQPLSKQPEPGQVFTGRGHLLKHTIHVL